MEKYFAAEGNKCISFRYQSWSQNCCFFRYDLGTGLAVIESGHRLVPGQWARIQARRWHRDGVLRVTAIEAAAGGGGGALSTDEVNGQSGGDLRSLDVDREPSFVGGLPKTGKTKNITRIAANLGMQQVKGRGYFKAYLAPPLGCQ